MSENIIDELLVEVEKLREAADGMASYYKSIDSNTRARVNKWYSSTKMDLSFILNQISPIGNDLLKVLNKLPNEVSIADDKFTGKLHGLVESTHNRIIKIKSGQSIFKKKTFIPNKYSNKIFIIHGHDKVMLDEISTFIKTLEFEPVILHEQPNKGKTIIEKFEEYSDVGFAIALFSPDDKITEVEQSEYRARQNVIFELGYFIGKIGRDRTVAIFKDNVQIPSDYNGVLYIEYTNSENWKLLLCKEMKAVGFNIDLNSALT